MSTKRITVADVLSLPVHERLQLVQDVWDSIADIPEALELTEEERAELDRRLEAYHRDPSGTLAWDEVKAHLLP
ncbi:addiction module protein [bacterium]|nr:addiction module protein [bacterium]